MYQESLDCGGRIGSDYGMTMTTAFARAKIVEWLELLGLFKIVESVSAPVRIPVAQRNLVKFYAQFVGRGNLVFDVGANVGEHSRAFLTLGARVVAVEPQASCARTLTSRLEGRVTVVQAAVGAETGEAELLLNEISNERATLSAQHVEEGRFARGWSGATEKVRVTTLDRLISEHGVPDVCKIDVETLEPEVVRGLSVPIATVIFEFHEGLAGTRECLRLLDQLGPYEFSFRIGRTRGLAFADWTDSERVHDRLLGTARPIYGDVVARLRA